MPSNTKKQYVPGRDHYAVYQRDKVNGSYHMEYVCKTSKENTAFNIAVALSDLHSFVEGRDYVVRALPTAEHTIGKVSTSEARNIQNLRQAWQREDIAEQVVEKLSPNGRVSTRKVLDVIVNG